MGFGLAVGAAILFTGLAVAGYNVTAQTMEASAGLAQARTDSAALDAAYVHSAIEVRSLDWDSGTVTLVARNVGSEMLDAADVDVLLDGQLTTIATRSVESHTGTLWPPMEDLTITVSAGQPAAATLIAPTGATGFWRA